MSNIKLSRDEFRSLRNLDRSGMERYLTNLYSRAFNEGVSTLSKEVATKVERGILNTKGIGEKRYTDIVNNINIELNK